MKRFAKSALLFLIATAWLFVGKAHAQLSIEFTDANFQYDFMGGAEFTSTAVNVTDGPFPNVHVRAAIVFLDINGNPLLNVAGNVSPNLANPCPNGGSTTGGYDSGIGPENWYAASGVVEVYVTGQGKPVARQTTDYVYNLEYQP